MRKLITIWMLLISSFSFAQSPPFEGGLSNTVQRQLTDTGINYRVSLGSGKGVLNLRSKEKGDSVLNSKFPKGLQGQVFKAVSNNSRLYAPFEPLIYGQFIYTDAQKARAFAAGSATQQQIFQNFNRFAHGGNVSSPNGALHNSDTIPLIPIQTNSYSYDTVGNRVFSLTNTSANTGFVSRDKFKQYIHRATFTAIGIGTPTTGQDGLNNGYDNDVIGLVIGFVEDSTNMVRNNAYGLSPGLFNWPINVTDQFIPDQHTLTLIRNRNGGSLAYTIVYDYGKLSQATILNGNTLVQTTSANWQGAEVDVQVSLNGDTVKTLTTDFTDSPGGKGALAHQLTLLLTSNPLLAKFRNGVSYGYSTQSQANASFKNIYFSGSKNIVYDLRNGDVFPFTGNGYTLDPTKNFYTEFGVRFFWRNSTENTFGYILPTANYDVIKAESPLTASATLDFPSTAAQTSSVLTVSVPNATDGQPVIIGVPAGSNATGIYTGYVSAPGVVTVKFNNYSAAAIDPASGVFNINIVR